MSVELIAELDASQNLNTSPYTVSNMEGDKYDYHFIAFCDSSSTTDGHVDITLNSDTGTNYSRFYMRGATTTASANVATSQTAIRITSFTRNASSRNSLAKGFLTGESGSARKINSLSSSGNDPQVYVNDGYWTNTVDEVTSMTFTGTVSATYTWHIIVYRVPKISDHGRWEHMADLSWSAETAEKSFTVDGDRDIQYRLVWDGDQEINVELNNDAGSNYTRQYLQNAAGTISAANSTTNTSVVTDGFDAELIINAESGVDRLIYSSASNTSSAQQSQRAVWWRNTADNLTSLDLTPSASATGTAKLYRRINTVTTADLLQFETIKTIDVSGDYSAGTTISGLALDQYKLVKIEWLGANTSGNNQLEITFNSIANYYVQRLRSLVSTPSGSVDASAAYITLSQVQNADQTYGTTYIYPKSGNYRPSLTTFMTDEDQISFHAEWTENSADEFTSIKIKALNTDSMTGTIIISVLR